MKNSYRKVFILKQENGTFVFFCDYKEEGDFDGFLAFVCEKMGVEVLSAYTDGPEPIAWVEYASTVLTAGWEDECFLRIPPESQLSAETIIEKCYGRLNPDQIATSSNP